MELRADPEHRGNVATAGTFRGPRSLAHATAWACSLVTRHLVEVFGFWKGDTTRE